MIGAEALGKWLAAASLIEHAADADAVDVRRFNTESDDPTRKDVHDDHHPEAIQAGSTRIETDRRSIGCRGLQQ